MSHDDSPSPKQLYDQRRYRRQKAEREKAKPPDPITLLDEVTIAYLAGLTDADGSIYATHTNKRRSYYPNVVWAMTHRPVIEWLCATLHSRAIVHNNHTNLRRGKTIWGKSAFRIQWRTQVTGRRAQLLCRRMLPYMRVKAEQAGLVGEFPVDERTAPGVRLSEEIRERREELAQQLSKLNHS